MRFGAGIKRLKDRGIIVIWLALFLLFVLLALAGIAIDGSYLYYVKNQLQVAADAAALAGAGAGLSGTDTSGNLTQGAARQAAWTFACKNTADQANPDPGGSNNNVYLVTNSPLDCNTPPSAANLNSGNNPDGDIVVGYWTLTKPSDACGSACSSAWEQAGAGFFCPATGSTTCSINAVKAVARRTGDAPMPNIKFGHNPVRLFLGQIMRLIGANWSFMNVTANAIAAPGTLKTPALSICIESCPIAVPAKLLLQASQTDNGMAWTAFDCVGDPSPPIGENSVVVQYINGKPLPTNPCGSCVTTNTGVGKALGELSDAFTSTTFDSGNKTFDGSGNVASWTVAAAVADFRCASCIPGGNTSACPPGDQPQGIHILQWASITITSVNTTGNEKGITISNIQCLGCQIPTGKGGVANLVK